MRFRLIGMVGVTLALAASSTPTRAQVSLTQAADPGSSALPDPAGLRSAATSPATSADACALLPQRIFVTTSLGTECISYYASVGIGAKVPQAVIHFHGDFPKDVVAAPARSAAYGRGFQARADMAAQRFGMPFIFVVRPGILNSTGDHMKRREPKEFQTMNAALDGLKTKYGIGRLALAGQSGGGSVVAAILALGRTDLACAVPGSGAFDLLGLYQQRAALAGRALTERQIATRRARLFSPIDHIAAIPKDARRRIFVVGDPRDKNTFFGQQRDYAYRVKAAGHHAVLLFAPGAGAKRHSVGQIADVVAGLCLQNRSDEEIERAISAYWQREFEKPKIKVEIEAKSRTVPPAPPLPVP